MLQVSVQTAVECEYLNTESLCATAVQSVLKYWRLALKTRKVGRYVFVYGLTKLSVTQSMQYQVVQESVQDKFEAACKEAAMPYFGLQ